MRLVIIAITFFLVIFSPGFAQEKSSHPCSGADGAAHPNGGGFVASTAKVEASVLVEEGASVCGFAQVRGEAKILSSAKVFGHAKIFSNSEISEGAQIHGNAMFEAGDSGEGAKISGSVEVYGNARIIGGVKLRESVKIYGGARLRGEEIDLKGNVIVSGGAKLGGRVRGYGDIKLGGNVQIEGVTLCGEVNLTTGKVKDTLEYCSDVVVPVQTSVMPSGEIEFVGLDERRFNSPIKLHVKIEGGTFNKEPHTTGVSVNRERVFSEDIDVREKEIFINYKLHPGENKVFIKVNELGANSHFEEPTFWVGDNELKIKAINERGEAVEGVDIEVMLADDKNVKEFGVTDSSGIAEFKNVPSRTVLIVAKKGSSYVSIKAGVGDSQDEIVLEMKGFNPPSPIQNNDFSQGLDGWEVEGENVEIIDSLDDLNIDVNRDREKREKRRKGRKKNDQSYIPEKNQRNALSSLVKKKLKKDDNDEEGPFLRFGTQGEGVRTISRTFETGPGVDLVEVRYRFLTTEIPGGYFGSKFNDSYGVSIRSDKRGDGETDTGAMNEMGLEAFDDKGLSGWMDLSLVVDPAGDVVHFDFFVENVGDGLYDSYLIIEGLKESDFWVRELDLRDSDPLSTALRFLSVSSTNPYRGGRTELDGHLTLNGSEGDVVEEVVLEVLQGGNPISELELSEEAALKLTGIPFGGDGVLSTKGMDEENDFIRLFELDNQRAGQIPNQEDGEVELRVKATLDDGFETFKRVRRNFKIMSRYSGNARYVGVDESKLCGGGEGDPSCRWDDPTRPERDYGGDDWALPSTVSEIEKLITEFDIACNHFSNMNGGVFPTHKSHQTGKDVDCVLRGHFLPDNKEKVANTLVEIMKSALSDIEGIFVTYQIGGPIYEVLSESEINEKPAIEFILNEPNHDTHFHIRFK